MKQLLALGLLTAFAAPLAAQPATTGPDYVKMAGASDMYERISSEAVLKCAKTPAVRNFATMMLGDHKKSTADVTAAAKSDRVAVGTPKMTAEQTSNVAEIKSAPAARCESVYTTQQVAAHEKALALHTGYSTSGDKPALKTVAAKIVPVVQGHLTEVRALAAK